MWRYTSIRLYLLKAKNINLGVKNVLVRLVMGDRDLNHHTLHIFMSVRISGLCFFSAQMHIH